MNDESPPVKSPAALPTLALIIAIALAGWLTANRWTTLGLLSCALLGAVWLPTRRAVLIAAALFFSLGISRGGAFLQQRKQVDDFVLSNRGDCEVTVRVRRAWTAVAPGRWRVKGESAIAHGGGKSIEFSEPLAIHLSSEERPRVEGTLLHFRGQLRRGESGLLFISCKSRHLLQWSGEPRRYDPREWNRLITERLEQAAERDPRLAAAVRLTRAVALGDSAALDQQTRRAYRQGGTYHLLVFSGMQIAFVAAAIAILFKPFRRPRLTDWTILIIASLAPLFAGSEVSVTRASSMIALYAATRLLRRPTTTRNLLFVSAALRLLFVPGDLFEAGFQLTYAAAGGILLLGEELARLVPRSSRRSRNLLRFFGCEIGIAPVSAWYFRRIVAGGSLITLLAAPLITVMLATSSALVVSVFLFPSLSSHLAWTIVRLNDLVLLLNDVATSLLDFSLLRPRPAPVTLVIVALCVSALSIRSTARLRSAAILLFVYFFLVLPPRPSLSSFAVEALDVGQGDSLLVSCDSNIVLVDGGGHAEDESFGDRVLLPLLIDRGITHLDAVALTHPHPDHCGGLGAVLRNLEVEELWLSGRQWKEACTTELFSLANEQSIAVRVVEHETTFNRGAMRFRPYTPRLRFKRSPLNNGSVVYRVTSERNALLLTGDIERDAETLLEEEGGVLRADVLKVAHHGSRTSTTEALLERVQPRLALISCGLNNHYGHPNAEVVERLQRREIHILRTDLQGCVRVRTAGQHLFAGKEFDTPRGPH